MRQVLMIAAFTLAALSSHDSKGEGRLGLYVGGAVGESRVEANSKEFSVDNFKADHSAFKFMLGLRPLPVIGAEVEYIDFGHPKSNLNGGPADATLKGAAAFGVLYLPVPLFDIYGKAGLARLQSTVNGISEIQPQCVPCAPALFRLNRTDTHFAAGAGAAYKTGALAIRAEYEYFNVSGSANPALVSLGLTWTFL
jgi:hypothetical protein